MEVARAAPDGYTLIQCFVATHSTNPAVLKLKYDPITDFAPVGMMAQTSNVLVVGEKNKAKNLQEFLAQARAQTGRHELFVGGRRFGHAPDHGVPGKPGQG